MGETSVNAFCHTKDIMGKARYNNRRVLCWRHGWEAILNQIGVEKTIAVSLEGDTARKKFELGLKVNSVVIIYVVFPLQLTFSI